jgi:hypothetical protein
VSEWRKEGREGGREGGEGGREGREGGRGDDSEKRRGLLTCNSSILTTCSVIMLR